MIKSRPFSLRALSHRIYTGNKNEKIPENSGGSPLFGLAC